MTSHPNQGDQATYTATATVPDQQPAAMVFEDFVVAGHGPTPAVEVGQGDSAEVAVVWVGDFFDRDRNNEARIRHGVEFVQSLIAVRLGEVFQQMESQNGVAGFDVLL